MKRTILFLSILFFNACKSDNIQNEVAVPLNGELFPQRWNLVAMSGMVADIPPLTGEEMDYQEYYLLVGDLTFIKTREWSDNSTEATGRFEILDLSDGKYLELTYDSDNELIGNCSDEPKELLRFTSGNELSGTWSACDGPGLFYKRAE